MNKVYDIITVWAGGAGLFFNLNLPKSSKKLIIEKNKILWVKVLMSWWERANLTNIDIDPLRDYFSCNKKAIISYLKRWSNFDTINFFEENGVKTKIEDRWRVITASWQSRELLEVLVKKAIKNKTWILKSTELLDLKKEDDIFILSTNRWEFKTKNIVIATWWKSFPQVGTKWFAYKIAEKFGINIVSPYKWLVWIVTKQDLSLFSGTTINLKVQLKHNKKLIYEEYGPLLFTHYGVSWPIVFNLVLAIGQYKNCSNLSINYEDFDLELIFDLENITKKLKKELKIDEENNILKLKIDNLRSWKEAKVTGGWIDTNELTKYLEVKKVPWLFFIWEAVDVTWKTWGFNLQWAWSSAYCCSQKFN